jgi:hypothetical protein
MLKKVTNAGTHHVECSAEKNSDAFASGVWKFIQTNRFYTKAFMSDKKIQLTQWAKAAG